MNADQQQTGKNSRSVDNLSPLLSFALFRFLSLSRDSRPAYTVCTFMLSANAVQTSRQPPAISIPDRRETRIPTPTIHFIWVTCQTCPLAQIAKARCERGQTG